MIKVNRSIAGRLGLLVLGFALFSQLGSVAQAADEEHGNPGQFVENIRKGLSGISKFFWSPKGLSAASQTSTEAAARKTVPVPITTQKATLQNPLSAATTSSHIVAGTEKTAVRKADATSGAKIAPKTQPGKIVKADATVKPVKKAIEQSLPFAIRKMAKKDTGVSPASQKNMSPDRKSKQSQSTALAAALPMTVKQSNAPASSERNPAKPDAKAVAPMIKTAKLEKPQSVPIAEVPMAKKKMGKSAETFATAKPLLAPKSLKTVKSPEAKKASPSLLSEKITAKQAPSQVNKKKQMNAKVDKAAKGLKKPSQAKKPAAKIAKEKRQPQMKALKNKSGIAKLVAKKKPQKKPSVKAPTVKKVQKSKQLQTPQKVASPPKKTSRVAKAEKHNSKPKGTYIWLPGKGSSLFARYGRSGIPASRLLSSGKAERKDGRWVFAPYKAGLLPGIYGLSEQINKVGDEETWVGRGRAWIYVFGKKRTYSSFFGPTKRDGKKGAQAAKPGALTKKSATVKKSGGAQQKSALGKQSRLSRKLASAAPTTAEQGQVSSKRRSSLDRGQPKTGAEKTIKNGNWEKKNGRWVYRGKGARASDPSTRSARSRSSKRGGLRRKQASHKRNGGWVYRNNRWIYSTPSNSKQQNPTVSSRRRGASIKRQGGHKNLARSQEKNKMAGGRGPANRLQGGAGDSQLKAMRNRKSWVRRDNRWVYANAIPSKSHGAKISGQAGERYKPGRGLTGQRSVEAGRNSTRLALGTKAKLKKRGQEFLFFVPGPTPGSGGWFAAPVELLRYARKVGKPEYRPKR